MNPKLQKPSYSNVEGSGRERLHGRTFFCSSPTQHAGKVRRMCLAVKARKEIKKRDKANTGEKGNKSGKEFREEGIIGEDEIRGRTRWPECDRR